MIGSKLSNRYEIVSELGRGGMGVVYRARDPLLERDVAVKVVSTTSLDRESAERFRREARVVARLDHPGIVVVYDTGEEDDFLYFVMPVLRGTPLRTFFEEGSLNLGELLDIGLQAAEALDYSHAQGVVHRDIKPENIMIERDGTGVRVRIADFGLAIEAGSTPSPPPLPGGEGDSSIFTLP